MKKTVSLLLAVLMAGIGFTQQRNIPPTYNNNTTDESPSYENGFKKENLFLGGNIALGFGTYSFNIGVNPEIGYSVSKWLDAGVGINLNYNSQTYDYGTYQTKYKNFNYGGGVFARAWAFPFLFFQVQPEMNWIQSSASSTGATSNSGTFQSTSLLAGIGYGSRMVGSHYSYITLMVDVLNDVNSPYRDYYGNAYPIFRAGFGFYLHPSRKR